MSEFYSIYDFHLTWRSRGLGFVYFFRTLMLHLCAFVTLCCALLCFASLLFPKSTFASELFFQLSLLPCLQQVQEVTGMVRKELCIHGCFCQRFPSALSKFWAFLLMSSFHLIWLVLSQPRSILICTAIWITSFWTEISPFCCSVTYADTIKVEHFIHL